MRKKCLVGGLFVLACVVAAALGYGPLHAWQDKAEPIKDTPLATDQKVKAEKTTNALPVQKVLPSAPPLVRESSTEKSVKPLLSGDKKQPLPAAPVPPLGPPSVPSPSPSPKSTDAKTDSYFNPPSSPPALAVQPPQPPLAAGDVNPMPKPAPSIPDQLKRLKKIQEERAALDKEEKELVARVKAQLIEERQSINDMEQNLKSTVPHLFPQPEEPKPDVEESEPVGSPGPSGANIKLPGPSGADTKKPSTTKLPPTP